MVLLIGQMIHKHVLCLGVTRGHQTLICTLNV